VANRKHDQFGIAPVGGFPLYFDTFAHGTPDKFPRALNNPPLDIHRKINVQTDVVLIGQSRTGHIITDDDDGTYFLSSGFWERSAYQNETENGVHQLSGFGRPV